MTSIQYTLPNIKEIRAHFPALSTTVPKEKQLVYLDNAATTQKPSCVLETLQEAYTSRNANVHRGVHYLSREATTAHEAARRYIATFIGADSPEEIIFTRGTTESINLVAATYCRSCMGVGDEILVSVMEHHSNIVPWQMQAEAYGFKVVPIPITATGEIELEAYEQLISDRTKLVAICHASNVLGTINPIEEIIAIAHKHGVPVCVDGAQAVAHQRINVKALDADFYAFSGHKVYGPTGIGVLYGKRQWLEKLPPYQGGGEMIKRVTMQHTEFAGLPYKYEAGTPNYIGSVALQQALTYIDSLGLENISKHEAALLAHTTQRIRTELPSATIFGNAPHKEAVLSFVIKDVHPYDLGTLLDLNGIAIRTGHHCAQPLMQHLGVEGTLRVSFALYNTIEEADFFVDTLHKLLPLLRGE